MNFLRMQDINLKGKRVLIREDLNVPLSNQVIQDETRIIAVLETIKKAQQAQAKVMIMSHLGRPNEGEYNSEFSLQPIADRLSELLDCSVRLVHNWVDGLVTVQEGEVVLLENVRFNKGEKKNDKILAMKMAALCDVFVMDAFATAHRAQASTYGVGMYAPTSCAGPLLEKEVKILSNLLENPTQPMVAIVGGSKLSTKLPIFYQLAEKCNTVIPGGGIANTFLAAIGKPIGCSLYDQNFIVEAKKLMDKIEIPLPVDVVCGRKVDPKEKAVIKSIDDVQDSDMILDFGPETLENFAVLLNQAQTILWNGPIGVFELEQFSQGTKKLALMIAHSKAFTVAGGGDTLSAIAKYNLKEQMNYISTGGGAFLEFMEGKKLPALAMLEEKMACDE